MLSAVRDLAQYGIRVVTIAPGLFRYRHLRRSRSQGGASPPAQPPSTRRDWVTPASSRHWSCTSSKTGTSTRRHCRSTPVPDYPMSDLDFHHQEVIMTEPQSGISYSALIVEALTRHRNRAAFIQGRCSRFLRRGGRHDESHPPGCWRDKGSAKGSCVGALSVNSPEVWMVQAAICLTGAMYTGLHPLGSVDDHVELCRGCRGRHSDRPSQVRGRRCFRSRRGPRT